MSQQGPCVTWGVVVIAFAAACQGNPNQWHELPAVPMERQVPDSSLVTSPEIELRLTDVEGVGFRLPTLYRDVIAVRFAASADTASIVAIFHAYDMRVVARHALAYMPIYYAQIPDPGPSWQSLRDFTEAVAQSPEVLAARTLPTDSRDLTHYVGPLLDGRFYDDRLRIVFVGEATESEARQWCAERGLAILEYVGDLNGTADPAPGTVAAALDFGPSFTVGFGFAAPTRSALDSIVATLTPFRLVRIVQRLPIDATIRLRGGRLSNTRLQLAGAGF